MAQSERIYFALRVKQRYPDWLDAPITNSIVKASGTRSLLRNAPALRSYKTRQQIRPEPWFAKGEISP